MELLTDVEARVLGCLIEKSITTPDNYPLSLNSLVNACNQKSNREPVMDLDERTVEAALDSLRFTHKIVVQVSEAGSRVAKFKHDIAQHLPHTPEITAILCELMVRGPQTVGELKAHGKRLFGFSSLVEIEDILRELRNMEPPLVAQLPPGAGRREKRFAHLLCGVIDEAVSAAAEPADLSPSLPRAPSRIDELEHTVAALQDEVGMLRLEVQQLKQQLGG